MRRLISTLIFSFGVAAALLAAAKLTFGSAIELPLLPRIPLGGVNALVMTVAALAAFALGALVARSRRNESERTHSAPAA